MLGSLTQMNKNRIIGITLFSCSSLIIWYSFILFWDGEFQSLGSSFTVSGAIASLIATSFITFFISPKIYSSKVDSFEAAIYGIAIIFFSYLLGSILFGIGNSLTGIITDYDNILSTESIKSTLLIIAVGFGYCVTFMSPGFILGGLTGVFYSRVINIKSAT